MTLKELAVDRPICTVCRKPIHVSEMTVEWFIDRNRNGKTGHPVVTEAYFFHGPDRCNIQFYLQNKAKKLARSGAYHIDWPINPHPLELLDSFALYDYDDPALFIILARGLLNAMFESSVEITEAGKITFREFYLDYMKARAKEKVNTAANKGP